MGVLNEFYVLENGVKIPKIGFGTWQIPNGEVAYNSVMAALKNGYRHIDTAAAYRNEESVGKAVKDSGIPREDIFITTKLESHIKDYEGAKAGFLKTLKDLDMDYVDLYLIHAPWPWSEIGKNCDEGNVQAYKAMEEFYKAGKIRAIGVSNFSPRDIKNILTHCEIKPFANQINYHIGHHQGETDAYCKEKNILVEAYSPLGIGKLLSHPEVIKMAEKYGKSPAQICIKYDLQHDTLPLPKSTHEHRIIENVQLDDFEISAEDMAYLDRLDPEHR